MAGALAAILRALRALGSLWTATFGAFNLFGWGVAIAVSVAVIAIWVGILHFVNAEIGSVIGSTTVDVFGVGLPAGAIYLINQAFPLQLFFDLSISLIVFRLSAAKLLMLAITATRRLKS